MHVELDLALHDYLKGGVAKLDHSDKMQSLASDTDEYQNRHKPKLLPRQGYTSAITSMRMTQTMLSRQRVIPDYLVMFEYH